MAGEGATLYVRNLNERVKPEALRSALQLAFEPFGTVLDIRLRSAHRLRGQAFVSFADAGRARKAATTMDGFELFAKPMGVALAKERADVLTKADGTYIPRERRRAQALALAEQNSADARAAVSARAAAGAASDAGPQPAGVGAASGAPPLPAANEPNEKLFLQGLPADLDGQSLQMLFAQFGGFREARTVPGRAGIAFVEFHTAAQATIALDRLQGFKLDDEHAMQISFAKR
ncbi:hypothetical protein KFE25_007869 [Diacronema lutheri]|uniref:RRM domain-containing protein n=1 Tax=Diacronema lutheri TaxID=2081491 RepID=A0A8J5XUR3_DIALT|nr:hypothetical protein KFE25_007869 [Diacronema lutheri]